MMNDKETSAHLASTASKVLQDTSSTETEKSLVGSVLSQVNPGNQTGGDMESVASAVLKDPNSTETGKSLAGSVLSQSNKDR